MTLIDHIILLPSALAVFGFIWHMAYHTFFMEDKSEDIFKLDVDTNNKQGQISIMKNIADKLAEIRQCFLGNLRYADPNDPINLARAEELGVKGFTIQSLDEALADAIADCQDAHYEYLLEESREGASL